jgi:hypothetical protein
MTAGLIQERLIEQRGSPRPIIEIPHHCDYDKPFPAHVAALYRRSARGTLACL